MGEWIEVEVTWTEEFEYTRPIKVWRREVQDWLDESGTEEDITAATVERFLRAGEDEDWRQECGTVSPEDDGDFAGMELQFVREPAAGGGPGC